MSALRIALWLLFLAVLSTWTFVGTVQGGAWFWIGVAGTALLFHLGYRGKHGRWWHD